MKNITRRKIDVELDTFCLISLFMKGFLQRENLEQNRRLNRGMKLFNKVKINHWGRGADFIRRVILGEAIPALCATLERALTESEMLFLTVCVVEFVDSHEMGRLQTL